MKLVQTLTLLIVVSFSTSTFAQDTPADTSSTTAEKNQFEIETERGKESYKSGDYKTAVDAFTKAYKARPTANLLYNIARCYDSLGDLERAEANYQHFIDAPGISQEARSDAVGRLKTVRDILAMKSADKNTKAAEKETVESSGPSPVAYALLGLGVVSLGAGVVTGLFSQSQFSNLEELGYPDEIAAQDLTEAVDLRDSGETLQIASIALLASGALLTTGGILTWVLTSSADDAATTLNLQPVISPNAAHVSVSASW